MAIRWFIYPCCRYLGSSPYCSDHGEPGEFKEWTLPLNQLMARYMLIYQVAATGEHRPLANELLGPLRITCSLCDGSGLLGGVDDPEPAWCPNCRGSGGRWNCTREEFERRRDQILEKFPEARVERDGNTIGPVDGLKVVF